MHIYVYGSVCRGDVAHGSDVDLLALVRHADGRFDLETYSVYQYEQIDQLWAEGNPFAWHVALEARMVFAHDGQDYVRRLGDPARYQNWDMDSSKFYDLFLEAASVLSRRRDTAVFELGAIFLSIRNLAICYSLRSDGAPDFSRRAFERLGSNSLRMDPETVRTLEDARLLSTRGVAKPPSDAAISQVLRSLPKIRSWMDSLRGRELRE